MAIPRMFCDLRYVVIDEVHSLMRGDRGGQTLCLIERLSRMAGVQPRRHWPFGHHRRPRAHGRLSLAGNGTRLRYPPF